MDMTQATQASVEVTVTHKVGVGGRFNISPTEAYSGVHRGVVTVTYMGPANELVEAFMAHSDVEYPADTTWVGYEYTDEPGSTYIFSLEDFGNHISATY